MTSKEVTVQVLASSLNEAKRKGFAKLRKTRSVKGWKYVNATPVSKHYVMNVLYTKTEKKKRK
jgi:hypothetical protein